MSTFDTNQKHPILVLFTTGLLAAMANIAAQPMSEIDKLLLLDDALEYASMDIRDDATALGKLQDSLTHIDNLLPEIRLQLKKEIANIYRDKALAEVNRAAQQSFSRQVPFRADEVAIDIVAWRNAIDAYEETVAFSRTRFPFEAAKSLAQIAELHTWKGNSRQRAHAFFRLRELLSDARPESSDELHTQRRLMDFSFYNLVGLHAAISAADCNRLIAEFPSDWEIRVAWKLEEQKHPKERSEGDVGSVPQKTVDDESRADTDIPHFSHNGGSVKQENLSDAGENRGGWAIIYFGIAASFAIASATFRNR